MTLKNQDHQTNGTKIKSEKSHTWDFEEGEIKTSQKNLVTGTKAHQFVPYVGNWANRMTKSDYST